jgi:hypothetical protein
MVKSNHEERLAWWLFNQGIPYFLPRLVYRSGAADVPAASRPLLKGFVFVGAPDPFTSEDHPGHPGPLITDKVKKSQVVYGFLFTSNQRRLRSEMALLANPNLKIRSVVSLKTIPCSKVKLGTQVQFIFPHCLEGLTGHIEGMTNHHQDIVNVSVTLELLGQMVSVKIDSDQVALAPQTNP